MEGGKPENPEQYLGGKPAPTLAIVWRTEFIVNNVNNRTGLLMKNGRQFCFSVQ